MLGFMIDKRKVVPVAKPQRKPIDIKAGHERTAKRFPKVIARLAE